MQRPRKSDQSKARKEKLKENLDTIWSLKRHATGILRPISSLQRIINDRISIYYKSEKIEVLSLYKSLDAAQAIQSVTEVANAILSTSDAEILENSSGKLEQWRTDLVLARKQITSLPPNSQMPLVLDKVFSRYARQHINSTRRLIPDLIESIGRLSQEQVSSENPKAPGVGSNALPLQVKAPIMTDVRNDTLVEVSGKLTQVPDNIKELTNYLSGQVSRL